MKKVYIKDTQDIMELLIDKGNKNNKRMNELYVSVKHFGASGSKIGNVSYLIKIANAMAELDGHINDTLEKIEKDKNMSANRQRYYENIIEELREVRKIVRVLFFS